MSHTVNRAILCLIIACLSAGATAQRRKKIVPAEHVTVFDTVRVVVHDTVRVHHTVASKRPTVNTLQHPQEIDSLTALWQRTQSELADSKYFEPYQDEIHEGEMLSEDSLYLQRLRELMSPIQLPYNNVVREHINRYVLSPWSSIPRILALSKYYFPIIEQELLSSGLPIELRAIPIIESNLSSIATSRVGAVGIWQFMPKVGRMLGLEINSLVDERRDPVKATRAACRLLRDLYRIYGDWTLAIAAFNCGPGNVNKAIARAGAKVSSYWDIWNYLPRETRGYVPKFIAASYAYAYHQKHGLKSLPTPQYIATDTITINRIMHLQQVCDELEIPLQTLRELNPQYKLDIIPAARKSYPLTLPTRYISRFIEREDAIMGRDTLYLKEYLSPEGFSSGDNVLSSVMDIYTVKKGDNISTIARRNATTVAKIMNLNKLKNSNLKIGQKLRLR